MCFWVLPCDTPLKPQSIAQFRCAIARYEYIADAVQLVAARAEQLTGTAALLALLQLLDGLEQPAAEGPVLTRTPRDSTPQLLQAQQQGSSLQLQLLQ